MAHPPDVLDELEGMAKGGPFRLDKDSTESRGWSRRWRLCLPEEDEAIATCAGWPPNHPVLSHSLRTPAETRE